MTDGLYLDHVLIAVRGLAAAADAYAGLGFKVTPEGRHPGRGTHNRLMAFGPEYLELIAVHDPSATPFRPSMTGFLGRGEGLYMIALGTDDIDATASALRARGVTVGDPVPGRRAGGAEPGYTWRSADLGRALPGSESFLIQHDQPAAERYRHPPRPLEHPNLVSGIHHILLAVRDSDAAARAWQGALGVEFGPPDATGGALRRRLALGNCFVDLASPLGPGALAEFLAAAGEGPFELALRTADIAAAAAAIGAAGRSRGPLADGADGRSLRIAGAAAAGVRLRLVEA